MARGIHANTVAVLGNDALQSFHIFTFLFDTPFRLTTHSHDISYDFGSGIETFTSTGRLVGTGDVVETLSPSNQSISLTMTGANEADIALALLEDFNDRQVIIRRGFYDSTGQTTDANILLDPFIIFDGRVNSFSIDDDPIKGDSSVTWDVASQWANWEKVNGRKCTNTSAKQTFADEEGFSHVYDQIGDKTWGTVRINTGLSPRVMLV